MNIFIGNVNGEIKYFMPSKFRKNYTEEDFMNFKIREATLNDFNKGLIKVFIEGYRYHQNGRPDIFANISDEDLKNDLIKNFERLSTIVILDDESIVGYLSYKIKKTSYRKVRG